MIGIVWLRTAVRLFDPPELVCAGCATDAFRRTQLGLALAGILLLVVVVANLVRIAATGRTWRRRRLLSVALAGALSAWAVLVLVVAQS